jgi:uncharacterized protein YjbI with pentapeptide repeats
MLEPDEEIPGDRCGFVLQPRQTGEDPDEWDVSHIGPSNSEDWAETVSLTTCVRETWADGRCIWHADKTGKPIEELQGICSDNTTCLDGAILDETEWPDSTRFNRCSLIGSRWSNTRARRATFNGLNLRSAAFPDADFSRAEFPNVNLRDAEFPNANLFAANFPDAYLPLSEFPDAYLKSAEFPGAKLSGAKFPDAYLNGGKFPDADLRRAEFPDVFLQYAEFPNAELQETEFPDADLREARFDNGTLRDAEFRNADLRGAEFPDADCQGSNFAGALLHDTLLIRTDCRDATFTSAYLHEAVFADTRINSSTTFYDPENTYYDSITSRPSCVYEENPLTADDLGDDTHPLEAARWVYRRFETLHEENAMSEEARRFHISKEEAERKLHAERGEWKGRLIKETMGRLTRHGESAQRTIIAWLLIIFVFGLVYPFFGGIKDSGGTRYRIASLSELATLEGWNDLLLNIYFSGITFSTIGYGDLSPAAPGTRALVFVESLVGAVLVALLVFVLGRRVAR